MVQPKQLIEKLTDRERDIVRGLGQGLTNAEIAEQLTLSTATVKWYTRQIYSKFQLDECDHKRRAAAEIVRCVDGHIDQEQHNMAHLPADVTPFIGRADDIASLLEILQQPFPRLLTIVGFGGTGKSRLALHIARQVLEAYNGHVFFISMKAVTDRDDLLRVIANAINCPLIAKQDLLHNICLHLSTQPTLLILDNAEHLVDIASTFITLLERIPDLKLLITSRKRLEPVFYK